MLSKLSATPKWKPAFSTLLPRIPATSPPASSLRSPALIGQADHDFLEQARNQTTCTDGVLSKERRRLSPLRATALPPDRKGKPSQPPRARIRLHQTAHCDPRFRSPKSGVSVP